jgi:hypothetical protein
LRRVPKRRGGYSSVAANMKYDHQEYGLAISTRDPRAVTGKHAHAAFIECQVAPACRYMGGKARESAPPYSNNPRPSIDGLPCANPPGAHLTGGGISNRSQSFSFKPGDSFPNQLPGGFTSHSQVAPSDCVQS